MPIITLLLYQLLNYFNVSYFKHIYLVLLAIYVKFNYEKIIYLKYFNGFKISLIKLSSIVFVTLYFGIAFIFIPHNSWSLLSKTKYKIDKYINNEEILIAAPLYFGFLYPKLSSKYLPTRQLGDEYCKKSINFNEHVDILLIDTQSLKRSERNDPQFKGLNNYIENMKLVEKIEIGRLATQSLDKQGYLYIYTK